LTIATGKYKCCILLVYIVYNLYV